MNSAVTQANKPETDVIIEKYYLLIGFETNRIGLSFVKKELKIFKRKMDYVHIISGVNSKGIDIGDYGHAFFYLTKNNKVETFFSFGPADDAKVKTKLNNADTAKPYADGGVNTRLATADYEISEVVRIFRIEITKVEFDKIMNKTDRVKKAVLRGKPYRALTNDTCAEEAEDILDGILEGFPRGKGYVENDGKYLPFKVVNPYMWHMQIDKKYKEVYMYPEYPHKGKAFSLMNTKGEHEYSVIAWILVKGVDDPLFRHGYYS